jgi:hypothetical protein
MNHPSASPSASRLVANRTDFLVVYLASMLTASCLIVGATILQDPSAPIGQLVLLLLGGAVVAIIPPSIGIVVPSGRRAVQIIFGAALLPVVGAVVLNGWDVIRSILK